MSECASQNAYDVVIVGAGMGGLTAGALLAKKGKQVLVVEQEEHPGGFVRELCYGPYKINPAMHVIMGCNPAGPLGQGVIDAVLRYLGVQDRCEFFAVDPFYRAQFPDFQLDVPLGREAYLDAHLQHFPGEADGLRNLVELSSAIFQEFMHFPAVMRWQDWFLIPFRSPKMFRHATATLASVIDRHLSNPQLKSVYALIYPYLALPPSRLPFHLWAIMMASYIEQGAYTRRGGFQNLADAFAAGVKKYGGELVFGASVKKIRVAGRTVQGIVLQNGQEIAAPVIISNIDARTTFQDLIEADQPPTRYLRKISDLEPSAWCQGLHVATDLDVQAPGTPKVTMLSAWDLEDAYASALVGKPKGVAVHVPTVADATLAPAGQHLVIIQSLAPAAPLAPSARAKYAEGLLDLAEQVLPNLREHITYVAGAADEEEQEYPLHRLGPMYGWANSVRQAGPRRLPNKSPIAGLYLAGHWTQPGSGLWTVVLSGINAARHVLHKNMAEPIWPLNLAAGNL